MKIDINNYEEYFLLYIDNEISVQERKEVELFLEENEELRIEFEMLKDTVNEPVRNMVLIDKSFLFKNEVEWINRENYEEIFVLYHDGELSEEQKIKTEEFLRKQPEFAAAFSLNSQAKLSPDKAVIFGNKKSLYRKEKAGRIIHINIYRSLAAAVFLGFGLWFFVNQNNPSKQPAQIIASVNPGKSPVEKGNTSSSSTKAPTVPSSNEPFTEPGQTQQPATETVKNKKELKSLNTETAASTGNKKAETEIVDKKVSTNIVKTKTELPLKTVLDRIEVKPLESIVAKENTERELKNFSLERAVMKASANNKNDASTASYIDPEEGNDNYIFYNIPADKLKRSKVGAFLKEVRRVVDRNDPLKLIFRAEEREVVKNYF